MSLRIFGRESALSVKPLPLYVLLLKGWDAGMIQDLCLGARYPSFKALEAAIDKFSKETNSVYIVNHSRTVDLENKTRPPSKQIPKCLKYKNIKFACKHYGKTRSSSRGLRPNQSSFKIGCPSFIYVSANTKELVVEKLETSHSHSCDPELVSLYPERRSLAQARCEDAEDDDGTGISLRSVREDVLDLLALGVERRRILNYAWITTGRKLFSGDLANLAKDLKDQPREVSTERVNALLNHLTAMESKQVQNTYKPTTKQIGLRAMKRKVPFPTDTVIKAEVISSEDSSEQCYSVIETEQGEQTYENAMYISDPMQLVAHGEDIQYQYEGQEEGDSTGNENASTAWSENSSLADVVKSILGPNQEGPVILHVNNYDGVAVVQVADPQSYTASDAHLEAETVHGDSQTSTAETPGVSVEEHPATRLIVKRSQAPKKPVVVTALPADSKKAPSVHGSLLKSAQLKQPANAQSIQKSSPKPDSHDDRFSEDGLDDDLSDSQSDHRSVLEEERTMYRVKTKKIRLQIDNLKNCIEKQDLEKRKLQLEIQLLKMQVDEKESEAKQSEIVQKRK